MKLEIFAREIGSICSRTPVASGRPLRWTIIANPTAGGFTIKSRWKKQLAALYASAEKSKKNPLRNEGAEPSQTAREMDAGDGTLGALGMIPTTGRGHASTIVQALAEEAASMQKTSGEASPGEASPFHLIIVAGGDGTSLEALTVLYHLSPAIRSNFAIIRLPMGTGNDGSDAWELNDALDLLIEPANIEYRKTLILNTSTEKKGPFLAFNILSMGADAFVTHMTNKMKGSMPGDSYKLWVDIAALFYDVLYKVRPIEVRAFDKGKEVISLHESALLTAVGESGHRTYGSHKHILPDDRNVCFLKQMSLFKKVVFKERFNTGSHVGQPEAILFNADKIEFRYDYPILAQMDGETVRLEPEDFPVSISLSDSVIPTLKKS
jgi:diacylglycerol kinase family enzyme